jgi:putative FmdB family regulatory protein
MPTYEYECRQCGHRFEQQQAMTAAPLKACPECSGKIHRLVSGGTGFINKPGGHGHAGGCSLEQTGRTCCGREERCGESHCEE